jgi:hypothetical protein
VLLRPRTGRTTGLGSPYQDAAYADGALACDVYCSRSTTSSLSTRLRPNDGGAPSQPLPDNGLWAIWASCKRCVIFDRFSAATMFVVRRARASACQLTLRPHCASHKPARASLQLGVVLLRRQNLACDAVAASPDDVLTPARLHRGKSISMSSRCSNLGVPLTSAHGHHARREFLVALADLWARFDGQHRALAVFACHDWTCGRVSTCCRDIDAVRGHPNACVPDGHPSRGDELIFGCGSRQGRLVAPPSVRQRPCVRRGRQLERAGRPHRVSG